MNKHIRHLLLSTGIGLLIFLFFLVLNWLNGNTINWNWITSGLIITASYAYPLYYVSAYAFDYVEVIGDKYKMKKWKSILIGFPFVIVINVAAIVLIQFLLTEYIFVNQGISFGNGFWNKIKIPLWISLTVGATFYIIEFINGYRKKQLKEEKEKVIQVTQSHEALKSQIGPHFLFNSLNVLSGLVDENPDKAQDFIADLAQVYRYVLDQKDKDWVSLSEEISFAENYLELVKTRFENGLEIIIQPNLSTSTDMIAPLTLQLLLENCIKHNAVRKDKPLRIEIFRIDDQLIVQNNINPKKNLLQKREGTGLKNIQNRYASINNQIKIEKNDLQFIVGIPLLTQKNIKMTKQEQFTEEELRMARDEVRERMGFLGNLSAYIIVCSVFVIINLNQGGYFWAIWPIIGWGTGVIFHGLGVFVFGRKVGDGNSWEDRQARKLLAKRKNKQ